MVTHALMLPNFVSLFPGASMHNFYFKFCFHISEQRGNSLLYSVAFYSHSHGFSFSHSNSQRPDLNAYTYILIVELQTNY